MNGNFLHRLIVSFGRVLPSISFSCEDVSAYLLVLFGQWAFLVAVH